MKNYFLKDCLDEILSDDKIKLNDHQRTALVTIRDKLDSEKGTTKKLTNAEKMEIGIILLELLSAGSAFFK